MDGASTVGVQWCRLVTLLGSLSAQLMAFASTAEAPMTRMCNAAATERSSFRREGRRWAQSGHECSGKQNLRHSLKWCILVHSYKTAIRSQFLKRNCSPSLTLYHRTRGRQNDLNPAWKPCMRQSVCLFLDSPKTQIRTQLRTKHTFTNEP